MQDLLSTRKELSSGILSFKETDLEKDSLSFCLRKNEFGAMAEFFPVARGASPFYYF